MQTTDLHRMKPSCRTTTRWQLQTKKNIFFNLLSCRIMHHVRQNVYDWPTLHQTDMPDYDVYHASHTDDWPASHEANTCRTTTRWQFQTKNIFFYLRLCVVSCIASTRPTLHMRYAMHQTTTIWPSKTKIKFFIKLACRCLSRIALNQHVRRVTFKTRRLTCICIRPTYPETKQKKYFFIKFACRIRWTGFAFVELSLLSFKHDGGVSGV